VSEHPNQIGSEQGRFLSTEETMRVVEFFFGKDRVEQALAEPVGYIEHH
jgi:hypothetical protein